MCGAALSVCAVPGAARAVAVLQVAVAVGEVACAGGAPALEHAPSRRATDATAERPIKPLRRRRRHVRGPPGKFPVRREERRVSRLPGYAPPRRWLPHRSSQYARERSNGVTPDSIPSRMAAQSREWRMPSAIGYRGCQPRYCRAARGLASPEEVLGHPEASDPAAPLRLNAVRRVPSVQELHGRLTEAVRSAACEANGYDRSCVLQ